LTAQVKNWGTAEIAIVISIIAIVAQIAPPFIEQYFDKKNDKIYQNLERVLENRLLRPMIWGSF
jgi:Tfp pilus assembly protein FimT